MAQNNIVIATVVSIDDPTYSGRIKVRVPGFHDSIVNDDLLPWCSYGGSSVFSGDANGGGGSISVARVGQQVRVKFNSDDPTSMEWYATGILDKDLREELKNDYKNAHVLLYDSAVDLSIKYQTSTGLIIYYKGSYIQITPDNNITIHYGEGNTGTQIQLSDKRVDIQAQQQINLTTPGTINLEADNIILNSKTSTQLKGDKAGEVNVNGTALMSMLTILASMIDAKIPMSGGVAGQLVNSKKEAILNQHIQLI